MANPFQKFAADWKNGKPTERALMLGGGLSLLIAIAGIALPVLPQVPFAVLAAFLFSKGSPRVHRWIRGNRFLGPPVKDWEDHQVIRPKLKIFSTVAMVGVAVFFHWKWALLGALLVDAVFLAVIIFLLTRRSKPPLLSIPGLR